MTPPRLEQLREKVVTELEVRPGGPGGPGMDASFKQYFWQAKFSSDSSFARSGCSNFPSSQFCSEVRDVFSTSADFDMFLHR